MKREYWCMVVLTVVNGLNFMDRNTIAGVLTDVKDYFSINDAESGAIQTVFFGFYMVSAPLFGFLGDRFNRKHVIICGLCIWNCSVLASSFVPRHDFWLFMVLRGCVGIGEGCFSIIAPTMIADYFSGSMRSKMFMVFYAASGWGCGLGFVAGSNVANALNSWKWGVRVGPAVGVFFLVAFVLIVFEPKRGQKDAATKDSLENTTSYWNDLRHLCTNPTFVLSTIGNTMNVFVTGTMSWWSPTTIEHARAVSKHLNDTTLLTTGEKDTITLSFGAVTCVASLIGVFMGTMFAGLLKSGKLPVSPHWSLRADPLVCTVGAIAATPCLVFGLIAAQHSLVVTYVLIFVMICGISFPWALCTEIQMNVTIPQRRNAASAFQIMVGHLFGDAPGPYLIGQVSDWLRGSDNSPSGHYKSLVKALMIPNTLLFLSSIFFFLSSIFLPKDEENCRNQVQAMIEDKESKEEGKTPL